MKKIYLFLLFLSIFITTKGNISDKETDYTVQKKSLSSESCFDGDAHIINVGIGFGGGDKYYKGLKDSSYSYKVSPAFNLTYEQALKSRIGPGYLGLGAYLVYQKTHYHYTSKYLNNGYYYDDNWTHTMIALRCTYHWDILNTKHTEVYIGGLAGVRIQTYSYSTNDLSPSKDDYKLDPKTVYPIYSVFAGARRYFTPKFALYAEAGYGISYFTCGINLKF